MGTDRITADRFNAPTIFVIFGATGDLMKRKLVPALFHLHRRGQLPAMTRIVAFSRRDVNTETYRSMVEDFVKEFARAAGNEVREFLQLFEYHRGDFNDMSAYVSLAGTLKAIDDEWGVCSNKLFHLAVPPQFYKTIFTYLADSDLTKPCSDETGWTRVLVEKPFGNDLQTAQELDAFLGKLFHEEQIFRIDHYLAKEAVQNILAFRFSNAIFESSWNKDAIEMVEIKLLEEIGIEGRGPFYDTVGALRDVGQNHMLQMLALIAMDRPLSFDAGGIRRARAAPLSALWPIAKDDIARDTIRGQYAGYRGESGVSPDSDIDTYFKITAHLKGERWQGVPFYLESGKRMHRSAVEIIITFKHKEPCLCPQGRHMQNVLYFQLQPNQEISVSLFVKRPGLTMEIEGKPLLFNYRVAYERGEFVEAYEKVLLDCISGDQTLFLSTEEIAASWKYIDSIVEGWEGGAPPLLEYGVGTAGPIELHGSRT